jgi:pimeloyl-ACP methyl ester carboxylesterase
VTTMATGTVEVPGARIYHTSRGSGPTLVLIHGGGSDCGVLAPIVDVLATRFTVVAFDRRGFGNSLLTADPVGCDAYLTANADDAAAVIRTLGVGPVRVFGTSSGAIVALELLCRNPDLVTTVVAHEPPVLTLLPGPDTAECVAFFDEVRRVHREQGIEPAIRKHLARLGIHLREVSSDGELPSGHSARRRRTLSNNDYWLREEIEPVCRYRPDTAALRSVRHHLMLASGRDSRDQYLHRINLTLSDLLGLPVVDCPGDHIGYLRKPKEFAETLAAVLPV